ncbi:ATP-dependent DNA helicase PIF1-like protein [Tanacetum coccineum]|uniref:ATP-dependent DNA helicase n=1 Tax=Tanacetum coccineum TaxID=301880 RepID=A0ABQ5AH69_9ASTR
MEFQVGDRVMLKVSPWKGVVRFGKRGKLNPKYVGPFKVLEKKCYSDEPLAVLLDGIHIDDKLHFVKEPIEIMDREVKRLKQSRVPIVKVRWNSRRGPEFTWELTLPDTLFHCDPIWGCYNDDREWTRAIQEASLWALGPQLHDLFVTILLFYDLTTEQIQNNCLLEIQNMLNMNGRNLSEFQDLPQPNPALLTNMDNHLIKEALVFDMNKRRILHQGNQKDLLIQDYHLKAKIRPEDSIASLLLPGGRTAHSRFVIPLELLENSTCGIKQNTHLAELMQQVELIIWDEAPMTQKYPFKALDKTLRDILGYPTPEKWNKLFGGVTVLLGGDFRQILPVIPKGKRADIVHACINRSELWKHCKVSTLTRSMRVNEYNANGELDTRKQGFNQWVLVLGDGRVSARMKDGEDEPTWIEISEKFLINSSNSPIEHIVTETYPNFIERQKNDAYLQERAILTPKNDDADSINAYMFKKLEGELVTYHSADEICEPLSPDHVFDFPKDEQEPHPAYDFFAPAPLPGYAGNPNNNNGWLAADDYLLGELEAMVDEQMVIPAIEEVVEPVAVAEEEQMIALAVDIEEGQMDVLMIDMRRTWPRCSAMMISRMMPLMGLARRRSGR